MVKFKGENVEDKPFKEKIPMLREVSQKMDDLSLPPMAETPDHKKQMFDSMINFENPLSTEGLVVYKKHKSTPSKAKITKDYDMKITGVFPASSGSKYEGKAIGGFKGIVENPGNKPNKEIKVATGLDDQMRKDAFQNPDKYIGEWAKIKSQNIHQSGKHQAPVLLEIRSEKYPNINKTANVNQSKLPSDFNPDYTPRELKLMGVYEEVYGDRPSKASMKKWPEE